MKTIFILTLLASVWSFTVKDRLTGRWETVPSAKGNVTEVVFKADNSFEGYVNKKPFTSGRYALQDSLFSLTDNGCDGIRGIYKIMFFHNADSIRFEAIEDSCTERKEGISRTILGRVN